MSVLDLGSRLWWRSAGSTLRFHDTSLVVWTLTEVYCWVALFHSLLFSKRFVSLKREVVALRRFEAIAVADADGGVGVVVGWRVEGVVVKWCWFGELFRDWAAVVVVGDVKAEKEAEGGHLLQNLVGEVIEGEIEEDSNWKYLEELTPYPPTVSVHRVEKRHREDLGWFSWWLVLPLQRGKEEVFKALLRTESYALVGVGSNPRTSGNWLGNEVRGADIGLLLWLVMIL
ncbi:hypothetical protein LR48_Vigan10g132300 [Vigna angularis]|uniref:Uncharacterized protein n=1 Tax=Phaseolus angularis TaxID=3914 RepID=A0A0L9VK55_PHAAN|nr:hypothetical protein LR48_Vigan10g132300 [Vigna angularis]